MTYMDVAKMLEPHVASAPRVGVPAVPRAQRQKACNGLRGVQTGAGNGLVGKELGMESPCVPLIQQKKSLHGILDLPHVKYRNFLV